MSNREDDARTDELCEAVRVGDVERVSRLVDLGACVNGRDNAGWMPLHYAVSKTPSGWPESCTKIVKLLIEAGADTRAPNGYGESPLWAAVYLSRSPAVVEALLMGGADVAERFVGSPQTYTTSFDTWSALHVAADIGCAGIVEVLVKMGADVNARDEAGRAPVHCAVLWGRNPTDSWTETLQVLLDSGADINARDSEGSTPLHLVASVSPAETGIEAARMLLENGAQVNVRDAAGTTPLGVCRSPALAQFLKDRGGVE